MISTIRSFRLGSHAALALALAGGAVMAGGLAATPAYAKKKEQEKAAKPQYSKGFVAAYKPVADKTKAKDVDYNAMKGDVAVIEAAAETEDDKMAAGQMINQIGVKTNDRALQRKGIGMMLASGKVPAESVGLYNFAAGQLAYQDGDYPDARRFVQQAIDLGYNQNDPQVLIAETYFQEDKAAEGLDYLSKAIAARVAAGQDVPANWIKRGLGVAYKANLAPQSRKFSLLLVEHDPGVDSWGDAIAIERGFFDYDDQQQLDLLRLARLTNTMRSERDYVEYITAADARRLPGEVKEVAEAGIAAGKLNASDVFVKESLGVANQRIAADKADLPGLAKDANAAGAKPVTVMAAGDAFLSYQDYAKAAGFYEKAIGMPGLDQDRVLTRLGISQVGEGDYAAAQATFAKVQGVRKPIANLWSMYAKQEAAANAGGAAAM